MSAVATAIIGSSVIGGVLNSSAAQSAADSQSQAATQAAQLQAQTTKEQLAQQQAMYDANVARSQPWIKAGGAAGATLGEMTGEGGQLTHQFNQADLKTNLAPGYQFQFDQGLQALNASAAARGGLNTGQGAKDIINYGQQQGQQGYQQAFQNYNTNQQNIYDRLMGVSTLGAQTSNNIGSQGVQTSSNMANTAMVGVNNQNNYTTDAARAAAAGQVGSAQAWSGALSGATNGLLTKQFMTPNLGNINSVGTSPSQYSLSSGNSSFGLKPQSTGY